jgi:hypothetical protein
MTVFPAQDPTKILHNPDMGWVLYENYPIDQDPAGSGTMSTLPSEDFPGVDAVALMFSWADVEKQQNVYDFSKIDAAYDYWTRRGKQILLRMSTESLIWWDTHNPPAGQGAPNYVLDRMPANQKQVRTMAGTPYTVVDARNPFYLARLDAFLEKVAQHFTGKRPVGLIDLRGFGAWGEWHSGFQFKTLADRRAALKAIIDVYSRCFPQHYLALSYSHDPDGPPEYFAGPTNHLDENYTNNFDDYLRYSAFDYALTKPNITFRRDGAGGAVSSNERKLNNEAFFTLKKGPMMSEFVDGYSRAKKGGPGWISWMLDDALSLHPNYINLLGWQASDALAFIKDRPDLVVKGLLNMGYRLTPLWVKYPRAIRPGDRLPLHMQWINLGVGRAMQDFQLKVMLIDDGNNTVMSASAGTLRTSQWVKGQFYLVDPEVRPGFVPPGAYTLCIALIDPDTGSPIALPLRADGPAGAYRIGPITVGAPD